MGMFNGNGSSSANRGTDITWRSSFRVAGAFALLQAIIGLVVFTVGYFTGANRTAAPTAAPPQRGQGPQPVAVPPMNPPYGTR